MLGEGVRLLLLSIGGWLRARLAELAFAILALVFFAVALVLASIAGYQAMLPALGAAASMALVAAAYLLLGGVALIAWHSIRRRRRRIGRGQLGRGSAQGDARLDDGGAGRRRDVRRAAVVKKADHRVRLLVGVQGPVRARDRAPTR